MELTFTAQAIPCLRPVISRVISQEESCEAIVPDSCPAIVRTAGCYGNLLLRSKDCRDGAVIISGGVRASVLVVPEDESAPRTVEVYLPFSQRVDAPEITTGSRVVYNGRIRGLDARLLNSHKVLVRADIVGQINVYEPSELQGSALEDCPAQVQAHRVDLPVTVVVQTGEKPFVIGEELEIPASNPSAESVLKWDCTLLLTDQKLIGARAVFKGNALIRMLYLAENGALCRYEFAVPFSQYAELDKDGEEDALAVTMMLTGAELEPDSQEPGRRYLLTLNILAQCVTQSCVQMRLVDDLYAINGDVVLRTDSFGGIGVLDRQQLRQSVQSVIPGEFSELVDASVSLGWPVQKREEQKVRVSVPAAVTMLYFDAEHRLQSRTERAEAMCETILAENADVNPSAVLTADVYSAPTNGGAEVRFGVDFQLECAALVNCSMIVGAELQEEQTQQKRPSVVIRSVLDGETIWSIAKSCKSSVEAVCMANGIDDDPAAGTLLLIPRV